MAADKAEGAQRMRTAAEAGVTLAQLNCGVMAAKVKKVMAVKVKKVMAVKVTKVMAVKVTKAMALKVTKVMAVKVTKVMAVKVEKVMAVKVKRRRCEWTFRPKRCLRRTLRHT